MATDKTRLVCARCGTINQFSMSRSTDTARCGKCKHALADGTPIDASSETLARHIQHSTIPVLVDFWAPWCGPCKVFSPVFQQFAKENSSALRCLKLDTEKFQEAGARYHIRSIPTLALFEGNTEVNRISGALDLPRLVGWVQQSLGR